MSKIQSFFHIFILIHIFYALRLAIDKIYMLVKINHVDERLHWENHFGSIKLIPFPDLVKL